MSGLTLQDADAIVQGALAKARELNCSPMTVAVVDAGGAAIVLKREVGRKSFYIPFQLLIKLFRRYPVNRSQIRIEHDAPATNEVNRAFNALHLAI